MELTGAWSAEHGRRVRQAAATPGPTTQGSLKPLSVHLTIIWRGRPTGGSRGRGRRGIGAVHRGDDAGKNASPSSIPPFLEPRGSTSLERRGPRAGWLAGTGCAASESGPCDERPSSSFASYLTNEQTAPAHSKYYGGQCCRVAPRTGGGAACGPRPPPATPEPQAWYAATPPRFGPEIRGGRHMIMLVLPPPPIPGAEQKSTRRWPGARRRPGRRSGRARRRRAARGSGSR